MNKELSDSTEDLRFTPRPSRLKPFCQYWLPVLLWMSLMFGFSTEVGSTRHTSRIIGPLLRWLIPGVSDATVYRIQTIVRKSAHVGEYGILSLLLWRARRRQARGDAAKWRWSDTIFALGLAVLFAVSDEVHQAFVPSREARVSDVFFDTSGAAASLAVLYLVGRWRGAW